MKTLMTFLFLAAALFPIQGSAHDDLRWSTATAIEVVFDRQMDIESLVKLKQDLTAQGVELTYTKLEFDPQGKLLMIDFSVSADGYNGSASSGDS